MAMIDAGGGGDRRGEGPVAVFAVVSSVAPAMAVLTAGKDGPKLGGYAADPPKRVHDAGDGRLRSSAEAWRVFLQPTNSGGANELSFSAHD
jgi:hypothetical protein